MCKTKARATGSATLARPRWGVLYALAFLMLAALAATEVVDLSAPVKTVLDCGLTLGGFGAIAVWRRCSRVALDRQEWCDCAGASVTVRVILSGRSWRPRAETSLEPAAGHSKSLASRSASMLDLQRSTIGADHLKTASTSAVDALKTHQDGAQGQGVGDAGRPPRRELAGQH
jgi:hypothetical protein